MDYAPITRTMVTLAAGKNSPAQALARCARFVRIVTAVETTITADEMDTLLTRLRTIVSGKHFIFTPEAGAQFATVLEFMAVQTAAQDILKGFSQ